MLDEGKAKSFNVDYLGFEVDWEHRFHDGPASPLKPTKSPFNKWYHLRGQVSPPVLVN